MYIGSISLMPRQFLTPEKGKTKAIFYNLYAIFKTIGLMMVQLRIKAVCNIQKI